MGCAVETPEQDCGAADVSIARPYSELSPEAQKKAIKQWRESQESWPRWDDVDQVTESLENDLEYEFGIDVAQRTVKCMNGKPRQMSEMAWGTYPLEVSYKADPDIEKLLAHGVPGCEYYSPLAAEFRQLLDTAEVLDAVRGTEPVEWEFRLSERDCEADYSTYCDELTAEQINLYSALAEEMRAVLTAIYDESCHRLRKLLDAEIDYQNSDECIADTLEANDYLFDEDGEWEHA